MFCFINIIIKILISLNQKEISINVASIKAIRTISATILPNALKNIKIPDVITLDEC